MNMMSMMKQARDLQKNMAKVQEELAKTEVTGTAAGDAVKITMTCAQEICKVEITPEAVDPDDIETLEDLVQTAIKDALTQAKDTTEQAMKKVTGGLQLPGM